MKLHKIIHWINMIAIGVLTSLNGIGLNTWTFWILTGLAASVSMAHQVEINKLQNKVWY